MLERFRYVVAEARYQLLLDMGNSRLKWGLTALTGLMDLTVPTYLQSGWVSYRESVLSSLLDAAWQQLPRPERVILCSVVPAATLVVLHQWLESRWSLSPIQLNTSDPMPGLHHGYEDPIRLGADRWLAMAGALLHASPPLVVVDVGTAMTIDLVDASGTHCGGWILPGLLSMQRQLIAQTGLKEVSTKIARLAPGLSTSAGMANGALLALVGAVHQVAQMPKWQNCSWLLSGGDGQRLQSHLAFHATWVDSLVLDGLYTVVARRGSR